MPRFFNAGDFSSLSGPEMARRRGKGYGKKIIECGYGHNALSLAGSDTGLSAHPDKVDGVQTRGKKTVMRQSPAPTIFATYLCPDQLREQRRRDGGNILAGCQFGSAVHAIPPAGWNTVRSRRSGQQYYFNPETGESRWSAPEDENDFVPTTRPLTAPLRGVGETREGQVIVYGARDRNGLVSARNMKRGGGFKPQLPRHGDSRNRTTPFNPFREELPPRVNEAPFSRNKDSKH
mmetsp:Transcript_28553/g.45888  ORF Transcript_28553/g.45888 Transcript_28553/m.45888 type:complete len:234 (+) Transcript_28553:30-731(+)